MTQTDKTTADGPTWTDKMTDECGECDRETCHEVRVEIRRENSRNDVAAFSREPYRISKCRDCGHKTTTRMNNA